MPERRVSTARRLLLLGVLAPIAVIMLEGVASAGVLVSDVMRLEPPVQNFRQAAYDSLLGWVSLPNLALRDNFGPGIALTTNADGIRVHRPIAATLAPGERRVICSGASFTFGSGVADGHTFCARLEERLPRVRTLNLAQRGYGIDQSYLLYRRDGGRYPHHVQLFAMNSSDLDRSASTTMTGYPKPVLSLAGGRVTAENVPVPEWSGWSRWSDGRTLLPTLRLVQLVLRRVDNDEAAQMRRVDLQMWPLLDSVFTDLARLNRARGSAPVIVYLPALQEYAAGPRDDRRVKFAVSAKRAGITFIDLTPDLRTVSPDSLDWLFITPNALPVRGASGHFTVSGHQWVADRISAHLRRDSAAAAALGL